MYPPQQRIERAKVSLINDPKCAYLAGILMLGNTEVTRDVPTARTNGRDVQFNPEFVDSLTDPELRALIYHEYGGHIMYRHLTTFKFLHDIDPERANHACDYMINQIIVDTFDPKFMKLPDGGLQNDKYRGMDSVQIFNMLEGQKQEQSGGMDDHDWEGAVDMAPEEQVALDKEITNAVRQGMEASKLLGNPVDREFEDWVNPQLDWREVLRDFVTAQCAGDEYTTYRKPRRRFLHNDMYLPTAMTNTVGTLVVAVDTSMSISDKDIAAFIAEVGQVCESVRPEVVHVLYWDSQVRAHEMYTGDAVNHLQHNTKPVGGGGTVVSCVNKYLWERSITPDVYVVLTDGYLGGDWGTWDAPIIWCIKNNRRAVPAVGVKVHID